MSQKQKLEAMLANSLGVADKTLAEYILNVSKQGVAALKQELADFPPKVVDDIIRIAFPRPSADRLSTIGQKCSGTVASLNPRSITVKLTEPKSLAGQTGYIRQLIPNIEINSPIEGKLIALDPIDIAPISPPLTKRNSERNLAVNRKVPKFLETENVVLPDRTNFVQNSAALGDRSQSEGWLSQAAKHTASNLMESRLDRDPNDEMNVRIPKNKLGSTKKSFNDRYAAAQKKTLPVHAFRDSIIESVAQSQVVIIVGNTGSGKTTQLTQFLHEAGYPKSGRAIACTQPRKLAAISVAERVAAEMDVLPVGGRVGYAVRFDDSTSEDTEIKYMTDGLLLREIMADPDLSRYSVVMLDEAHERTIATDILFGLLKNTVARRPEFRIIVTSATLDSERFSKYFGNAPILTIPGRTFPVEIEYLKEPVLDYVEAALMTVKRIHSDATLRDEKGDILVFLTGQAEIEYAQAWIADKFPKGDLYAVPVFSAIPSGMQSLIFDPAPEGKQKVVLATNIAETSLTIDGIRFVVDPGFVKIQAWDPRKGMNVLKVQPISQAQANQRSGRAGRTAPGSCYRLYTEVSFSEEMLPAAPPEIQRVNLDNSVLLLKAMGIDDILNFDFMDPPPRDALVTSLEELYLLEAIDEDANITYIGRQMAAYPLDPALSKVVVTARKQGPHVLKDVLIIIAMLSMPSVFYRPMKKAEQRQADNAHRHLRDETGDHLTLLNVYQKWAESGYSKKWCDQNFIQKKVLSEARDAFNQLTDLVGGLYSADGVSKNFGRNSRERKDEILKILCSGFFQNVAKIDGSRKSYTTVNGGLGVYVHPSSVLYRTQPDYVLFTSLTLTSKEYMRVVSQVRPEWLISAAPHFYRYEGTNEALMRQQTETIKPLFNKFASHPDEWRVSKHRNTLRASKR